MPSKYLYGAFLFALFGCFAESQEAASYPIHNFFFFDSPGDFNRNIFYRNKMRCAQPTKSLTSGETNTTRSP